MTADETPDELRARVNKCVAAFRGTPSIGERAAWARQIVDAWPAIDALLARLTAAEADRNLWRIVAQELAARAFEAGPESADRIHDEAVALRERSS